MSLDRPHIPTGIYRTAMTSSPVAVWAAGTSHKIVSWVATHTASTTKHTVQLENAGGTSVYATAQVDADDTQVMPGFVAADGLRVTCAAADANVIVTIYYLEP